MIVHENRLKSLALLNQFAEIPNHAVDDLIETVRELRRALAEMYEIRGRCSKTCEVCDEVERLLGLRT